MTRWAPWLENQRVVSGRRAEGVGRGAYCAPESRPEGAIISKGKQN
jgi:hypothetical protein